MHELFPLYTHTHHGRVLTTLDLHVQILDDWFPLCRCTLRLCSLRIAGASPYSILVLLSFQLSYYFLILVISDSVLIPVIILALDSYDIMRGCLYVALQYSCFISVRYIACFRLLKA